MAKYRIKEPVVFLVAGNKVMHYQRPADLVTLDDKVAAKLGDVVERRGESDEPEVKKVPEKK